ncbi:hypothetical protein H7L77_002099 [Salmonella enterica]|nr:hypothetical protein [Salmonella enterica]
MISASLQQRKTRTRRSMLFVPGANAAMVSNSFIYPADALMFDLEDSVALREKDAARRLVYHALQHPLYRDVETIVRVNALDSEWGVNDLEAVVRGGASLAVTRFLEDKMRSRNIVANFALGGITATMVDLHEKGLIRKLLDVQSFDRNAAQSLARNPNHIEISANQYANWGSKGASVDRLDVVVLSALEVDTHFNVNVLTGSDGVLRGASGGHCDTAVAAALSIIVAPLVRGRIPTMVDNVTTCVTPGSSVDILVTDHGIAVNPARPELAERLQAAGMKVVSIEWLRERAQLLTGQPRPIEFTDRVIAVVRYRDGSVIDVVHQVKE